MATQSTERSRAVQTLLTSVVGGSGLVVEDVAITPAGKRRLVRVLVDRDAPVDDTELPDSQSPIEPLSLDEVAEATRLVSDALDESDAMGEAPYVLEVSSPGTDRPLALPRHFRRNVGRLVAITTADGATVDGRIVAAGTDDVRIETGDGSVTVAYADCTRARVELEFNRAQPEDLEDLKDADAAIDEED